MSQEAATFSSRFREFWRRLQRVDPLRPEVFWPLAITPMLGVILYDGGQFGFDNQRLWLATAISYPLYLGSYILLSFPFTKVARLRNSALGKLGVVLFAFGLKNVTMVLIVLDSREDQINQLLQRAPGDLTVSIILWGALATASTANLEYRVSLSELNRVSDVLEEQRDKRINTASIADKTLRQKALATLQGELEKISHGLKAVGRQQDLWRVSVEIKDLLQNKVRPLSHELRNRINLLSETALPRSRPLKKRLIFQIQAAPALDPRFILAYFVATLNIFVTVYQLSDLRAALSVQVVSLSFPIIAWAFVSIRRKKTRVSITKLALWMTAVSVVAYLPTLWILNLQSREFPDLERIQVTAYLLIVIVLAMFTGWSILQRARNEQLQMIEAITRDIKRELTLIDQAVWMAQRKWSYLIHGTVQGALTVASSRLVFEQNSSPELVTRVIKDLEKAKRALQSPVDFNLEMKNLMRELRASWHGICEVQFDLSDEVIRRVNDSETAKSCFNELCKEIVSNSFRHGKAKSVLISAYLNDFNDLTLIASNDGVPLQPESLPGLGFAMFDELTSSWSVESALGLRVLATIPMGAPTGREEAL